MLEAVGALLGGLEGEQRVEEVRYAETVLGPAAQIGGERLVIGGVVRQQGASSSMAAMARSTSWRTVAALGASSARRSTEPSLACQGRMVSTASLSTGHAGWSATRTAVTVPSGTPTGERISVMTALRR